MHTLQQKLKDPTQRQRILDDAVSLLEDEVAAKGGLMGIAVKGGYKMVKTVKPGITREILDKLLDPFTDALLPFLAEKHNTDPNGPLEPFFKARGDAVATALLKITDEKANASTNGLLKSTYGKLRPVAVRQIIEGLPRLSQLVSKHL